MNENIEVTKLLLEDYIENAADEVVQVNMLTGSLGNRIPFTTTLTRQMTLDDYMEKHDNNIPSFMVYEIFVNPRFFMKWTPRKMAMEIRQDFIKKIHKEG